MSPTIGVAVVTKNEAKHIGECLAAVEGASQIVVVDSGSTDDTAALARARGATVIFREWAGYSDQKQFALDQLSTDWVLALDGDEVLTPEAWREIKEVAAAPTGSNAFRIPRHHAFNGRILRHGRGVDFPLRLARRGHARYSVRAIHEELVTEGQAATLRHGAIHYSSPDFRARLRKIQRDTDMELQVTPLPRASLRRMLLNPARYFASYMLRRGGWRDGWAGALWTGLFSYQLFLQELKYLRARQRR